jgi:2-polyprenyl-3-methyl-5-hydroxy-6-metoxy-1,4-benzoquinol methylase
MARTMMAPNKINKTSVGFCTILSSKKSARAYSKQNTHQNSKLIKNSELKWFMTHRNGANAHLWCKLLLDRPALVHNREKVRCRQRSH